MKSSISIALCTLLVASSLSAQLSGNYQLEKDWLVDPSPYVAQVREDPAKGELILENGLARRVIRLAPNAATVSLKNLVSGEELLRAVSPEARVTLDGTAFAVGG